MHVRIIIYNIMCTQLQYEWLLRILYSLVLWYETDYNYTRNSHSDKHHTSYALHTLGIPMYVDIFIKYITHLDLCREMGGWE